MTGLGAPKAQTMYFAIVFSVFWANFGLVQCERQTKIVKFVGLLVSCTALALTRVCSVQAMCA